MAEIGKAPEGFPRLMQAARALAGVSIEDLATALKEEQGLSARSLRSIESGKTEHVPPSKRRAIIAACDLPNAFLSADIWWLQDLEDAMDRLSAELLEQKVPHELIREAFEALAERQPEKGIEGRLATLEAEIRRLDPVKSGDESATDPRRLPVRLPDGPSRSPASPSESEPASRGRAGSRKA